MSSGSPKETGTPIRYPASSLLCVSTNDSFKRDPTTGLIIEGPNPASCDINIGRSIMSGQIRRIALTECNVQWDIPNVNERNFTLTLQYFNTLGVSQGFARIFIQQGFYSPAELLLAISDALNFDADLTAYFGANPFIVSMVNDFGTTTIVPSLPLNTGPAQRTTNVPRVSIELSTAAQAIGLFAIIPSTSPRSFTGLEQKRDDLTTMLGFAPSIKNGSTAKAVQIVGGYASFQYTPYIDIVSRTLTQFQKVADADTSAASQPQKLARLYLANEAITPFFASASYAANGSLTAADDNIIGTGAFTFRHEFKIPKMIEWNSERNIDVIQLELLDSNGIPLPILYQSSYDKDTKIATYINQAEFQFTLQASEA